MPLSGADEDVDEVVHAPVEPGVGHEDRDRGADDDDDAAQPHRSIRWAMQGEGQVERGGGADVTAGVARGRRRRVEVGTSGRGRPTIAVAMTKTVAWSAIAMAG